MLQSCQKFESERSYCPYLGSHRQKRLSNKSFGIKFEYFYSIDETDNNLCQANWPNRTSSGCETKNHIENDFGWHETEIGTSQTATRSNSGLTKNGGRAKIKVNSRDCEIIFDQKYEPTFGHGKRSIECAQNEIKKISNYRSLSGDSTSTKLQEQIRNIFHHLKFGSAFLFKKVFSSVIGY